MQHTAKYSMCNKVLGKVTIMRKYKWALNVLFHHSTAASKCFSLGSHMCDAGTSAITAPVPASHLSHSQFTLPSANHCECQYIVNDTPRSVHRSLCELWTRTYEYKYSAHKHNGWKYKRWWTKQSPNKVTKGAPIQSERNIKCFRNIQVCNTPLCIPTHQIRTTPSFSVWWVI